MVQLAPVVGSEITDRTQPDVSYYTIVTPASGTPRLHRGHCTGCSPGSLYSRRGHPRFRGSLPPFAPNPAHSSERTRTTTHRDSRVARLTGRFTPHKSYCCPRCHSTLAPFPLHILAVLASLTGHSVPPSHSRGSRFVHGSLRSPFTFSRFSLRSEPRTLRTAHTPNRAHSEPHTLRTAHTPNRTRTEPHSVRCQRLHSIPATTTAQPPHASPADCVPRLASLTDFVRSHRGSHFVRTAYRSPPVLAPRTRVETRPLRGRDFGPRATVVSREAPDDGYTPTSE